MTSNDLIADADLCVKCGLCLPYCPTYQKTLNENESPRGRIALIQAWANQDLPTSKVLLQHIDNCLLCRSCERVCPAEVPYGSLVDNFWSQVKTKPKQSVAVSLLKGVSHNRWLNRGIGKALHGYHASGLQKLSRVSGFTKLAGLQVIDELLPEASSYQPIDQDFYPAEGNVLAEVGLFKGCMGELVDASTLIASIKILNRCGFHVHVPKQQGCCGALALHDGDAEQANELARGNIATFAELPIQAIVSTATGCGATLQEYRLKYQEGSSLADKVTDISHFLNQTQALRKITLKPLEAKILIHNPCSLRNVMGTATSVEQLLSNIAKAQVEILPETISCCGAAGSFMLKHPVMAQVVLEDIVDEIEMAEPALLVSSNIGCALHIQAGLKQRGLATEVIHPIELLLRQWPD